MDIFMNGGNFKEPKPSWYEPPSKRYGCFSFIWDIFMTCLTGGLWLIWIFVREMRKRG